MNDLLKNARWMDGIVWFVVTGFGWLFYETQYRGVPLTAGLVIQIAIIWGLASAGYAIISGAIAERDRQKKKLDGREE